MRRLSSVQIVLSACVWSINDWRPVLSNHGYVCSTMISQAESFQRGCLLRLSSVRGIRWLVSWVLTAAVSGYIMPRWVEPLGPKTLFWAKRLSPRYWRLSMDDRSSGLRAAARICRPSRRDVARSTTLRPPFRTAVGCSA